MNGPSFGGVLWRSDSVTWSDEADVVVVGAGAGGLVAAIAALDGGASALLLEKAPVDGGTSRKSGGGCWVPCNHHMRAAGVEERSDDVLRYLARTARPATYSPGSPTLGLPAWEHEHLAAFCVDAPAVFEHLDRSGILPQVQLSDFPDYFQHLDEDVVTSGHLIVTTYPDGTPADGVQFIRRLRDAVDARGGRVLVEHRVVGAVLDEEGAVAGVVADTPSGRRAFRAVRAVVFASGGFTWNPDLRQAHLRGPLFGGCAAITNEGDFVPIAQTLGASMRNMQEIWGVPILIDDAVGCDAKTLGTHTTVGDSMIYVNRYGVRSLNEKELYNEKLRSMWAWDGQRLEYPNLLQFVVWDQRTQDRCGGNPYDGGLIPAPGVPASHVVSGQTLAELAVALDEHLAAFGEAIGGLQLAEEFAERLAETIARYNEFARTGLDEDFHRGGTPTEQYFNAISIDSAGYARGTQDALRETQPWTTDGAGGGAGRRP